MSENTSPENTLRIPLIERAQAHPTTLTNKETARPKARGRTVPTLFL
jgi:hypothetical protein